MGKIIQIDAGRGIKGYLAIDYDSSKDAITGKLHVPRKGGTPFQTTISVDLGEIRKQVKELLSNRTGWSLKGAQRAMKRATSKAAMQKLLRTTNNIMKDPRFKGGVLLASTVFPPLGITYATIQQGADIVQKAQQGDQESQMTLAAINSMAAAQQGSGQGEYNLQSLLNAANQGYAPAYNAVTNAQQMLSGQPDPQILLQGMRAIYMAQQQGGNPGAAVSGWFYERNYRPAALLSPTLTPFRWAYNRGMELEKSLPKRKLFSWS